MEAPFFEHYLATAGRSEVPVAFHRWAGFALLAACVADRVTLEKFRGARFAPNLYVFLIGPSGCGKGEAIDHALRYLPPDIPVHSGTITGQGLMKRLARRKRDNGGPPRAKLLLVTEELAMCVGSGHVAEDFVRHVTGLYRPAKETRKLTMGGGEIVIQDHCVTWLAGTTVDWLVRVIPRDAIEGGFLPRVVTVHGQYNPTVRIHEPTYGPGWAVHDGWVRAHLAALVGLEGQMDTDEEARRIERQWYEERPVPADEAALPAWKRQHDLLLKFSMLHALADDPPRMTRTAKDIVVAQAFVQEVTAAVPLVIRAASTTRDTEGLELVRRRLAGGPRQRGWLLRCVSPRGINAKKLSELMDTLVQSGEVRVEKTKRGFVYTLVGARHAPAEMAEAEEPVEGLDG